jgi:hypothetical protein
VVARKLYPNGIVQERRARENGALIQVVNGEQYGVDTDGGSMPWSTICCEHTFIVFHSSLKLALGHASQPTGWCECCAGREGRQVPRVR